MRKEKLILLCAPVLAHIDGSIYPEGSITDLCGRCSRNIWLAPTGQAMKREGASLVCIPCGLPMAKREGVKVLKETLEEIERQIPGGAAQAIEIVRRFNARHN